MLLKSIKLQNFRQFINLNEITFSTDLSRNVTVVLGENGSGKTSLAQAFTWCLYGITDFKDTSMLNKIIENKMLPGRKEVVRVDIELVHEGIDYNISRIQTYKMQNSGTVSSYQPEFFVAKKIDGQQEFSDNPELEIKQILPKELSGYFFLNGEHIQKLIKELNKGKSLEFANAVENLLGLRAILEAIEHFNPRKRHSVIGSYTAQYDGNSNQEVSRLSSDIQSFQDKIQNKSSELETIESEIEYGEESCKDLESIIRENQQSAEFQKKVDEYNRLKLKKEKQIENDKSLLLVNFNKFGKAFISKSLIADALNFLASENISDKGIPEIHQKTIEFLINRGFCLCGTQIIEGKEPHAKLMDVINYIPPKSIGILIREFKNSCENDLRNSENYFENFQNNFTHIRTYQNEIADYISGIEEYTKLLSGMKAIGEYQSKLSIQRNDVNKLKEREKRIIKEIGVLESQIDDAENRLHDLALKDNKNSKIEKYKNYATAIHIQLVDSYKKEEARVRQKLEEAINEIFKQIYEGGMSISVDEKYRIRVIVDEVKGFSSEIETSTAQSTSVIFAFISGIIKLAKEFSSVNDPDLDLLASSEPYPLLMDAPLSNFDKRRIKTVCETLPKVAEQVIVFIKDTDGDIAEKHLGSIIGRRYRLNRESEIETFIVER